jgi:hypothetical protein
MAPGLRIHVVELDEDYLGIDVRAASDRFAGTARMYAGLDQLGRFAKVVEGFPLGPDDRRDYEFGTRGPGYAGGFVAIKLRCADSAGHVELAAVVEDDSQSHAKASAELSFAVEAAELDRFAAALRQVERERCGNATLVAAF